MRRSTRPAASVLLSSANFSFPLRAAAFKRMGCALAFMWAFTADLRAGLLAYEPFTNVVGTAIIGSTGGDGFSGAWQANNSAGTATNLAASLSYTDGTGRTLVTAGGAGFFQGHTTTNGSMQPIRLFNFSRGTNGTDGVTTWISFLVARQGPTGTLSGNPYGRGANVPHDLNNGALQKLAIGNGSGLGSNNVSLIPLGSAANARGDTNSTFGGVTNFVVLRIDHITNGTDSAWLFVNPNLASEPSTNSAGAVSSGTYDFSFDRLRVFAGGQSSAAQPYAEMIVDEYRLGQTYADVTPAVTAPVAAAFVFTNVQLAAGNVILRGTGGTNGVGYQLLGSATLSTPSTTWPVLATNVFDANGNFLLTNPLPPGVAQQFYRLRIAVPGAPLAPFIVDGPTNLTVTQGQSAGFSVNAGGTAPLAYQWFFNTNTALAGQTATSLTLNNVQPTNAGAYSVVITNVAGAVTSSVAMLTVLSPPVITVQPQSLSVVESNAAAFTVTATGTAPLAYRWFFNTNTLVGGNSNAYTRVSAQTNHAGTYSVIVTNTYGAVTSGFALLTVTPASAPPDFSLVGFAALDGFASNNTLRVGGTTGGAAGALVIASNVASFKAYLESTNVYRVLVISNLDLSSLSNHSGGFPAGYATGEILVRSHKTIYSTNGATISRGSLRLGKPSLGPQQNVIIKNLKFRDLWVFDPSGNYDTYGWDYVHLEEGSHHVWVDHCDFDQVYDGMIDVVHASDYVTASWNIFRTQKKCSLIGHSDGNAAEDTGHLNVTFHHNYYVDVEERMPRMRFGNAHVFNLYCENLGGNGIQSTASAATLVENSHFQFPQLGSLPTREENGGPTGIVKVVSCVISNSPGVNVQFRQFGQTNFLFNAPFVGATPPYSYAGVMHPVAQVPNIVTNWAGVGKLTSF